MSEKKYKLALIGYGLSKGGGEKVMANLSLFFESVGIEIHVITVLDGITYPYGGTLVNLGLMKDDANGLINKWRRLQFLRNYLKNNNFDFIIDFRPRTKNFQELIISKFIYKAKTILTVHSFLIEYYLPKSVCLTKLIYDHNYATVVVLDEIKDDIASKYALNNLITIQNPINFNEVIAKSDEEINLQYEYIIGIGQFNDNIKQFDKLIISYANSNLPQRGIHLIILGTGNKVPLEKISLENAVSSYVHFLGFQENPFKFLRKALFLVMSSLNEGMPNVLLESLACGTPVISFDCPTGPRAIIKDKFNGLLVENQNIEKLTQAIDLLFVDKRLYYFCKGNSVESIQKFSLEIIGKKWLEMMKIELPITKNQQNDES